MSVSDLVQSPAKVPAASALRRATQVEEEKHDDTAAAAAHNTLPPTAFRGAATAHTLSSGDELDADSSFHELSTQSDLLWNATPRTGQQQSQHLQQTHGASSATRSPAIVFSAAAAARTPAKMRVSFADSTQFPADYEEQQLQQQQQQPTGAALSQQEFDAAPVVQHAAEPEFLGFALPAIDERASAPVLRTVSADELLSLSALSSSPPLQPVQRAARELPSAFVPLRSVLSLAEEQQEEARVHPPSRRAVAAPRSRFASGTSRQPPENEVAATTAVVPARGYAVMHQAHLQH